MTENKYFLIELVKKHKSLIQVWSKNVVDRHMLRIFCCYKNMNKNTHHICTFVQESCYPNI